MNKKLEKKRILVNIEKMKVASMEMELKILEMEEEIERRQGILAKQEKLIADEQAKLEKLKD